jgi:hypothetical protein
MAAAGSRICMKTAAAVTAIGLLLLDVVEEGDASGDAAAAAVAVVCCL